ncbi:MAG: thiol-disulfide oxidoreductase DCC family protein [Flavobacteriaceae bacterium]
MGSKDFQRIDLTSPHTKNNTSILFFDGDCPFCNDTVMYLAKLDTSDHFMFVSNISELGKGWLEDHDMLKTSKSTIVLKTENGIYVKASAIKQFLLGTGKLWWLRLILTISPRPFNDMVYNAVSNRRKSIKGNCTIPNPLLLKKFVY